MNRLFFFGLLLFTGCLPHTEFEVITDEVLKKQEGVEVDIHPIKPVPSEKK